MKLVVSPFATVAVVGETAMAVSAGAITVSVALFEVMPLSVALMLVLPCASVVAMPLVLIVAIPTSVDAQITEPDTLPVLLSAYVAVAVKVAVCPWGVDEVGGVMLSPLSTAALTVRLAGGEVMPLSDATMVVPPIATPVATPVVLLMVAIKLLPVDQVTWLVMSAVEPSL